MSRGTQIRPPLTSKQYDDALQIIDHWRTILGTIDGIIEHRREILSVLDRALDDSTRSALTTEVSYYELALEETLVIVLTSAVGRPRLLDRWRRVMGDMLAEQIVDSVERLLRQPADPAMRALRRQDRHTVVTLLRLYEEVQGMKPRPRRLHSRRVSGLLEAPPARPRGKRGGPRWTAHAIVAELLGCDADSLAKKVRARRTRV